MCVCIHVLYIHKYAAKIHIFIAIYYLPFVKSSCRNFVDAHLESFGQMIINKVGISLNKWEIIPAEMHADIVEGMRVCTCTYIICERV